MHSSRDHGNEKLDPFSVLLTEETHEKPKSGWQAPGFEPKKGTTLGNITINTVILKALKHTVTKTIIKIKQYYNVTAIHGFIIRPQENHVL